MLRTGIVRPRKICKPRLPSTAAVRWVGVGVGGGSNALVIAARILCLVAPTSPTSTSARRLLWRRGSSSRCRRRRRRRRVCISRLFILAFQNLNSALCHGNGACCDGLYETVMLNKVNIGKPFALVNLNECDGSECRKCLLEQRLGDSLRRVGMLDEATSSTRRNSRGFLLSAGSLARSTFGAPSRIVGLRSTPLSGRCLRCAPGIRWSSPTQLLIQRFAA
jgi:hypothetical protein